MIHSLPSILHGHVVDTVTCTRVMAGPENIKEGFMIDVQVFDPTFVAPQLGRSDKLDEWSVVRRSVLSWRPK